MQFRLRYGGVMDLKNYVEKQEIIDFMEGVRRQLVHKEYTDDLIEMAAETMTKIFKKASMLSDDDADAFLTTCLAVYILESYSNGGELITDISPEEE